nr:fatty acyl-CoA reductase 2-like [Halyomorpha halys]
MASDNFLDFVPVDHAIKAFLIAPWKLHVTLNNYIDEEKGKKKMAEVYNCASSRILRLTVGEIERYGTEIMDEYPSSNQVWVKSVRHTTNKTAFSILFLLHQILPALFADLVLLILRKQPIALRLTKKMVNAYRLCGNLVGNNIGFPNERYMALGKDLKDEDLASFSFALYPERKREILHSQVIGFRKYFLKEDMTEEAIKNNRKRMDRIKFAHGIITSLLYLTAAWCLVSYCGVFPTLQGVILMAG